METDFEDPEYLPKKWKSAVERIIASIDPSSAEEFVPPATRADSLEDKISPVVPAAANRATATSSGSESAAAVPAPTPVVPFVADVRAAAPPAKSGTRATSSASSFPSVSPPAPSHIVIPVLVPYLVPGLSSTPGTPTPAPGSPPTSHVPDNSSWVERNNTIALDNSSWAERNNSSWVERNNTIVPVVLAPPLHPAGDNNQTAYNQTTGGPSSSYDPAAAVGWTALSVTILLTVLAAFSLSTSQRLKAWCRHCIHGSRYRFIIIRIFW